MYPLNALTQQRTLFHTFDAPDDALALDGGRTLTPYTVAYQTWGKLNADRSNAILFSPVFGKMTPLELATRVMADALPNVRMQLQMHKIIWEPNQRGV